MLEVLNSLMRYVMKVSGRWPSLSRQRLFDHQYLPDYMSSTESAFVPTDQKLTLNCQVFFCAVLASRMSSLDSRAAFKARTEELSLEDDIYKKLVTAKLDTFGALAFIGPLQAGNADETPLIEALKSALGGDPTSVVLRIMRRSWFEATTQALAEMKGKVERTDASEPIRMPLAERTQRVAALQKRLVGVHWSVDVEPSHRLQDQVAQMVADQSLIWLQWDKLTSRSMEITAEKTDSMVLPK